MFITIEGVEGSGKTTQVGRLGEALAREGRRVCVTREPGGTPLGSKIRALLLEESIEIGLRAELLLMLADRAEHVERTIRPALELGEVVLCDRFSDSTLAYQAFGRGLPLEQVRRADEEARGGLLPDLTLVLDCPVEVGLERTRRRRATAGADRFESEALAFHERVRQGFLALARESPERIRVLDGREPADRLANHVLSVVRQLLPRP